MGQLQNFLQGSQKSQQYSVMVLCFLKYNQYEALGFNYGQLNKKLNIFPSIIINPFRIFVNDLEVFQTTQEFQEYVQCVNLESDLKRIVIFIDVSLQEQFNQKYCKIILSETYNQISEIFIFDDQKNAYQQNYFQIQQFYKNFSIFTDKQKCFQKILVNSKDQSSYFKNLLNHQSTQVDEKIIQNIMRILENEITKLNTYQCESVIQFEKFYQEFTDIRNYIIQSQFTSTPQKQRTQYILQCKFNYKIMQQISRFTNFVFDLIFKLIKKFEIFFYFCQTCMLYVYKSGNNYMNCIFFNGCFKNQFCKHCQFTQASFDNLKILYDSQKMCFQIEHCLQQINQNEIVQSVNDQSPSNVVNNQNHHIILIGKTGVGKTTIFNLLSDGKASRLNDSTQEPMVKKCLNSNLTIMDTPPFELEKNDSIENSEKIKLKFSNILTQQQVSQIFIIVKYDRLSVMKQNIVACLKFLGSFRDKISIIIFNDSYNIVKEQQNDLEKIFETNRILIFNMRFAKGNLNEEIEKHLFNFRAKLEYLKIENTDFDINKSKKEQKAMIKKLEKMKMQNKEVDVQELIKENQSISIKIELLNKEQLELIKKLNQNSQKIQDYCNNMVKQQNNTCSLIKFD